MHRDCPNHHRSTMRSIWLHQRHSHPVPTTTTTATNLWRKICASDSWSISCDCPNACVCLRKRSPPFRLWQCLRPQNVYASLFRPAHRDWSWRSTSTWGSWAKARLECLSVVEPNKYKAIKLCSYKKKKTIDSLARKYFHFHLHAAFPYRSEILTPAKYKKKKKMVHNILFILNKNTVPLRNH